MTNDLSKQITDFAEKAKQYVPQVTFTKNGYEIRSHMLDIAKDLLTTDFNYKFQKAEFNAKRDSTGALVSQVTFPDMPGAEQILETAQKFYDFVNQKPAKK